MVVERPELEGTGRHTPALNLRMTGRRVIACKGKLVRDPELKFKNEEDHTRCDMTVVR